MIRAAVFDLDGTLLNTIPALKRSMDLTLAEFGFGAVSEDQVKRFVGTGSLNYCRQTLEAFGADTKSLLEDFAARYGQVFEENCRYETRPYPGIPEALSFLKQEGVRLFVLSNKPQSRAEDNIYTAFGPSLFDDVRGERPGVPLKPDPTSLFRLLSEHGILPGESLYFGDTGTDMETGTRGGCHTAGVLWGFREREELEAFSPEAMLQEASEIPAFYRRLQNA